MTNCANTIEQQAPGEQRALLEQLQGQVEQLLKALPAEQLGEAKKAVKNLDVLVNEVTSEEPDRRWYSVSAEGLLEAATYVKDFSGAIGGTIQNLGKSLWPDFLLPQVKK